MNIKRVRIMKCIDPDIWYYGRVGEEFRFRYAREMQWYSYLREAWVDGVEFMVIDNEGKINSIAGLDCRLILGVER